MATTPRTPRTPRTSPAADVDPEPEEIDWTPEQLEVGERVAAAHGLGHLSPAGAAFYAYCSVAFWYHEDHGQPGPHEDEYEYEEPSDLEELDHSAHAPGPAGENHGVIIYSPGFCRGDWSCPRNRTAHPAGSWGDEPPF
jgi:hypothetical protein